MCLVNMAREYLDKDICSKSSGEEYIEETLVLKRFKPATSPYMDSVAQLVEH